MNNKMLHGVKLFMVGLALVTLCAAEDGKPASDLGPANMNERPRILHQSSSPALLTVKADAINAGGISRDDFNGLEKTLSDYQSAFEAMNLPGIQRVWPNLDRRREAAFRGVFKFLQKSSTAPRLDLQCIAPAIADRTVAIDCREAVTYSQKDNKSTTVGPVRVSIFLKKESNNWFVQEMKGL